MASYFNLTLDTTSVSNPTISLENGNIYATNQLITAIIGCGDGNTTGYSIKIWGSIDTTFDINVQDTETNSSWITYTTSKQIKLSSGDGLKTVYLKVRDDVWNESSQVSDSINLDLTLPTVTVSGSDVPKISKITGKNTASFSFQCSEIFDEYMVKVVASSGAAHDTGTTIPSTGGSTNISGSAENYPANTPINVQIKGIDFETASAGDGIKVVKVFCKDKSGVWSA